MANPNNTPSHNCAHCNELCENDLVWLDEKPFCCLGCKTVYEILNEHGLCDYYEIDRPTNRVKTTSFGERFAFLDTEEIADQLFYFKEGNFRTVNFYIPNIHCSSCIWLLENLHKLNAGVSSSVVNFVKKTAKINFKEDEISLRKLVELMASIGYPPDINLEGTKEQANQNIQRQLLIKMGVAGFCFGNIMLMSFPEYFSFQFKDEAHYIDIFAWLNLILSIPILLYSARDYYTSAYKGLKHKIINIDVPISLGIFVLFFRSSYEVISNTGFGYFDSLSGLVFFLLVGKWFQGKTYSAMSFERDFRSYFPLAVTLVQNNNQKGILVNQLKKGDEILIRNGELVPSDSILITSRATIDYSFVTGESELVGKQKGDLIYAGGRQQGESIHLIVQQPVSQSYLTDLWNQAAFKTQKSSGYESIIDKVSQYFTVVIMFIAVGSWVFWQFNDPKIAIEAFTAVLIIACPCALALSLPFTLGNSIRILGRFGFYLKNSLVVENLAKTNTIVFDKTGTITKNQAQEVLFHGNKRLSAEELLAVKHLCWSSIHPLSKAIYDYLPASDSRPLVSDFQEITGKGIMGGVNGYSVKVGSPAFLEIQDSAEDSAVHISINDTYKGYFKVKTSMREGYGELLTQLKEYGYDLHLITGDHKANMQDWLPYFSKDKILFSQSPKDKLEYIENLNAHHHKVIMVGDGLNDSGALKQAQVGIAISDDVYSFSPACDAILDSGHFNKILSYLKFSRSSMQIVKLSFALSFLYNVVGMYFAVQGALTPIVAAILMPLSSISVVVFVSAATAWKARDLS
ncbi:MAG: heavy metal translocating P-type ATPase metal-binding domain-containing protein [Flavobacteriales bacterium]|nr:heavy metal translocating P-type ATPase metal-binding domain-containing protein [Flavobacteriales bacterium]